MNYLELLASTIPGMLMSIPLLLAWLFGIVLAVRMIRRGGGKSEKLLLAGCSLMLVEQIVSPFLTSLALWLTTQYGMTSFSTIGMVISIPRGILNMAGIVCLILAFWFRWRTRNAEA
ncbi:hypothetical protein ACFLWW_01620 [Chloroflexota bacterium]